MDLSTSLQGVILGISLAGGVASVVEEYLQQPPTPSPIEAALEPTLPERGIENTGPWAVAVAIAGAAWGLSSKVNSALEQGKDAQNLIRETSTSLREATSTAKQAYEGMRDLQDRLRSVQRDIDDMRRMVVNNDERIKSAARRQPTPTGNWSIRRPLD